MPIWTALKALLILGFAGAGLLAEDDPLAPWRSGVKVTRAIPEANGHSVHSYFNTCPESPDGQLVLYFASGTPDGQLGDVCVRNRTTGRIQTLARDLDVEDVHRVACQQWVSKGRRVVFHSEKDGRWQVTVVDLQTGKQQIAARDRLAGWGQPGHDVVPLYGLHWDASAPRDLELLDVSTGEITTALPVRKLDADWISETYSGKPVSIFFPVLSPDATKVFFKLAAPAGGVARSRQASLRRGLICYSLTDSRILWDSQRWGHPSWHPDSGTILNMNFHLYDSSTGAAKRLPNLPSPRVDHPSFSPDGRLIVTDTTMDRLGGSREEWGIIVADARGGDHVVIHRFANDGGARSWRRSHPHPVFSPDGKRIYFNTSSGKWTQIHVAARRE